MHLHHVGFVYRTFEDWSQVSGLTQSDALETIFDVEQRNDIYIFRGTAGTQWLELIVPRDKSSTVWGYAYKAGPGLHHHAFRSDNLEATVAKLRKDVSSVLLGSYQLTVETFGGAVRTQFVFKRGVITEYVQVIEG